jgi:hypothetical protein
MEKERKGSSYLLGKREMRRKIKNILCNANIFMKD